MISYDWSRLLLSSTESMFAEGKPLMQRVLPHEAPIEIWRHYPGGDVVSGEAGSRYFYHCHPPGERAEGEHGHFHLFLARSAMPVGARPLRPIPSSSPQGPRADVVHIAALAISTDGLPISWFTTNRWVTDEWLYPWDVITQVIDRFDMRGADGDPFVNDWLTAMVALSRDILADLLMQRDAVLEQRDLTGEDRAVEITSLTRISLDQLFTSSEKHDH